MSVIPDMQDLYDSILSVCTVFVEVTSGKVVDHGRTRRPHLLGSGALDALYLRSASLQHALRGSSAGISDRLLCPLTHRRPLPLRLYRPRGGLLPRDHGAAERLTLCVKMRFPRPLCSADRDGPLRRFLPGLFTLHFPFPAALGKPSLHLLPAFEAQHDAQCDQRRQNHDQQDQHRLQCL